MKKLFPIVSLCIFTACNFFHSKKILPEERAKDSVISYLKLNLNDPSSYEAGNWSPLDKKFTEKYTKLDYYDQEQSVDESTNDMLNNYKLYLERDKRKYYARKKDSVKNSLDSQNKIFKPKLIGYTILHSYRAKNRFGAKMLHSTLFTLDTSFNVTEVFEDSN